MSTKVFKKFSKGVDKVLKRNYNVFKQNKEGDEQNENQ